MSFGKRPVVRFQPTQENVSVKNLVIICARWRNLKRICERSRCQNCFPDDSLLVHFVQFPVAKLPCPAAECHSFCGPCCQDSCCQVALPSCRVPLFSWSILFSFLPPSCPVQLQNATFIARWSNVQLSSPPQLFQFHLQKPPTHSLLPFPLDMFGLFGGLNPSL